MNFDSYAKPKGWSQFESRKHLIAGGCGTLNKVPRLDPDEPALIDRGRGCRVWDVDGNEYIDFRCALGPVTLGYCRPEIDDAIRHQLSRGLVFGQPSELEFQLAEELIEVIPCAESVRFLKTGGEAVAATLKLARAFTGRNMVLGCGYWGWLNSFEQTEGLARGVAESFRTFHYGDLGEVETLLQANDGEVAAVLIAGAYAAMQPDDPFPRQLRELTTRYGVLLIIDEIVTGFRLRMGGYHEYYDFMPDLAVYSKGMANGMPLSVFAGRKEIMDLASHRAVVSSTFSGETLSLAASLALLKVYRQQNVVEHLWKAGGWIGEGMNELFARYGLPVELRGLAPCRAFIFHAGNRPDNLRLQRALFRSFYRHGVSMHYLCFVNFAHRESDIGEALKRMELACRNLTVDEEVVDGPPVPMIGTLANLGT